MTHNTSLAQDLASSLFIEPDLRRKRIRVSMERSIERTVRLSIEGSPHSVEARTGSNYLKFAGFEPWTPQNPRLYELQLMIAKGGAADTETSIKFGMREFGIRQERFVLNHQPVHINAFACDTGFPFDAGGENPGTNAAESLQHIQRAGFNALYLSSRFPVNTAFFDLCDQRGMLVFCEIPLLHLTNQIPERQEVLKAIQDFVRQYRNHPAVVAWCLPEVKFRESADFGAPSHAEMRHGWDRLLEAIDPSRPILTYPFDEPAHIFSRARPSYHKHRQQATSAGLALRPPIGAQTEAYCRDLGTPDRLSVATAGASPPPLGFEDMPAQFAVAFRARGLQTPFGSVQGFLDELHAARLGKLGRVRDLFRLNRHLAGAFWTLCPRWMMQLAQEGDPGPGSLAGKHLAACLHMFADTGQPLRPVVTLSRTVLYTREEAHAEVHLAGHIHADAFNGLSLQITGPTHQTLWKKKRGAKPSNRNRVLWSGPIAASGAKGTHVFTVRLMAGPRIVAENSSSFYVAEAPSGLPETIRVLEHADMDPAPYYALAPKGPPLETPVHVVPPVANSIRAYPAGELAGVLDRVWAGAAAIMLEPPNDWNDLIASPAPELQISQVAFAHPGIEVYHYCRRHPVFESLPGPGIMGDPYQDIVPSAGFKDAGEEDICGSFVPTGVVSKGENPTYWTTGILLKRYGAGYIAFTHLRIADKLGANPVADTLLGNLIHYLGRRAIPSKDFSPFEREFETWLKQHRAEVQSWRIAGYFPNWDGSGHDAVYPPEDPGAPDGPWEGLYGAVEWRRWHTHAGEGHELDALAAFFPAQPDLAHAPGTWYAQSVFHTDYRRDAYIELRCAHAAKVWFNGRLVHERTEGERDGGTDSVFVHIRQGRNTLLLKVAKGASACAVACYLTGPDRTPIGLTTVY